MSIYNSIEENHKLNIKQMLQLYIILNILQSRILIILRFMIK